MMFYKNTKTIFRLPNESIDFFVIRLGVLQRDTLTKYLSVLSLQTAIDLIK